MKRRSRFRPAARRDLLRLVDFLAEAPPHIAQQMMIALERAVDRLRKFPFIGRPLHRNVREKSVRFGKSRYIIRYTVSKSAVTIVRVWHAKEERPKD